MAFTPLANKDYEIEGSFLLSSTVTTTGARVGIALPTGLTDSAFTLRNPASSTSDSILHTAGGSTSGLNANTGASVINVSYLGKLDGLMRCGGSPVGNFKVQFASEIAASAVTLKAGSFIKYRALN